MARELSHTNLHTEKTYIKYPIIFAAAFLLSATRLFGGISPFCAALVGSLSGLSTVVAFGGAVLGFFLTGEMTQVIPSMVSLLIIGTFRLLLSRAKGKWVDIAASAVTAAAVGVGLGITAEKLSGLINAITVGLIAGISAYALIVSYAVFSSRRGLALLKPHNIAALAVVYTFAVAALTSFQLTVFNLGIAAAVVITLTTARKYRYSGAALCGIISAFGIGIAENNYITGALVVCLAAIGSVLFNRLGKLTQTTSFIMLSCIGAALLGINSSTVLVIASAMGGGILYLLLPTAKLTGKIRKPPEPQPGAEVSEIFAERLRLTGAAMNDVCEAVEKTATILDKKNGKDISWVYDSACDNVCKKCRSNTRCWGTDYNDLIQIMRMLTTELRKGKTITPADIPMKLRERCNRQEMLIEALTTQYREYVGSNAANRKIAEMRSVLTAQLLSTEKMMQQMAKEFKQTGAFDRTLAAKIEALLSEHGIRDVKAGVSTREGRISIEAYGNGKLNITPESLCNKLISALSIEFDLPDIVEQNGQFRMTCFERAIYSIEYGAFQHSHTNEKSCGDYHETFMDKNGYAYIVLSDGMGTGSRARIDSAFACSMLIKLLRAGVSFDCAIEVVNSSLLVKSADESFATLDVCRIDLYTGRVDLFKAGGAPTYIKCNKRIVKAAGRGYPVGISHKPMYEQQSFTIGNSDMIIMTSDGADVSEKWLEHELNIEEGKLPNMEAVAENIASAAKFACEKGRDDDISVVVARIVK